MSAPTKEETIGTFISKYKKRVEAEAQADKIAMINIISKLTPKNTGYPGVTHNELVEIRYSQHKQTLEGIEQYRENTGLDYNTRICCDCFINGFCGHSPDPDDRDGCIRFIEDQDPVYFADFKLTEDGIVWVKGGFK